MAPATHNKSPKKKASATYWGFRSTRPKRGHLLCENAMCIYIYIYICFAWFQRGWGLIKGKAPGSSARKRGARMGPPGRLDCPKCSGHIRHVRSSRDGGHLSFDQGCLPRVKRAQPQETVASHALRCPNQPGWFLMVYRNVWRPSLLEVWKYVTEFSQYAKGPT